MEPSDPTFWWLYAAEMAACVREASRWDWGPAQRSLLRAATELSERLYEGADPGDLLPLFEEMSEGLRGEYGPRQWLATLDGDSVEHIMMRARKAFHCLRYLLFEEGPPLAA
jgi:hypothetical protein